MILGDYVTTHMNDEFILGTKDCGTFVGGWIKARSGFDPSDAYRGRFKTTLGYRRFLARNGGLLALADREMIALREIQIPRSGDVGIVRDAGGLELWSIYTGHHWLVKLQYGVGAMPALPLRIWRVD